MTSNEDGTRLQRKAMLETFWRAALRAVDPRAAVHSALRLANGHLTAAGKRYDLRLYRHVYVVGAGKATAAMALGMEDLLGQRIAGGLIAIPRGSHASFQGIAVVQAGHPIPDDASVAVGDRISAIVSAAGERDLVICLLSGGASALMSLPAAGLSLEDKQRVTDALLRAGATINELNAVRKHLSAIKGGRLAALAAPATLITLVLSDVVGSPLDVIASGPTVADPSTFRQALDILGKYDLIEQTPPSVIARLCGGVAGTIPETPKPGAALFARVQTVVVGSSQTAAFAALSEARRLGWNALLLSTFVEGEARQVGLFCAAIAKEIAHSGQPIAKPGLVVASGETTVTVRGTGRGGRNQELVLAAALQIAGADNVAIVAFATDGTDGPTDAAGAYADGQTIARTEAKGLDPQAALAANDSYAFFSALGDLIITGPTGTNVNDLILIACFELQKPEREVGQS